MPSNHLILYHPLLLPFSIFPSIRVFSNESVLHIWWPKYWSFNFSISPSSEYSGLISFKMDWLDLLAVQGTLNSLLQHHSSKASILRRFPTKVHLVKALVFPVVMDGCERWTIKKAEHQRIDASELWCWRRLLIVPWTARRKIQPVHPKGNQSWDFFGRNDAEAETPVLWPPHAKS